MAPTPPPSDPANSSPAGRLARARAILDADGRPARPGILATRDVHASAAAAAAGDAPPAAAASPDAPAPTEVDAPVEPARAARASTLAFGVLTGAIRPLTRPEVVVPSRMRRLGTALFPAPSPGQPSRLELAALGAALVGAAFVGTTIPGSPVQAQGLPPQPAYVAAAAAPAPAPVDDGKDATTDAAADPGADLADSSQADTVPPADASTSAAPADTSADDTSTGDETPADDTSGDAGDGSDPLAGGGAGGDTLARVALVVVHGDAPVRWATADKASPAGKRAASGTTFTNLATLPNAPLATGLGYIAGQASNPATRAGCTAPSPVTPGTVDSAGVTAGAGCDYPPQTPSIPGAVARDGRTWKAYVSGAATAADAAARLCHPTDGAALPAAQRSPLGHLADLTGSGACDAAAAPISNLRSDLTADAPPAWVYAEVGECGTDGCDAAEAAARDRDLDAVLATLATTKAPDDGRSATLVVGDGDDAGLVPADAGTFTRATSDPDAPAAVLSGALLLGDDVTAGSTDPLGLDPLAITRTQASWLGLTAPGLAAADGVSALAVPGF
ncbi:MAG: hypothetical protein PGN13_06685 [Patulibacter minatonensis]